MNVEWGQGLRREGWFHWGRLEPTQKDAGLRELVAAADRADPLALQSPFEGVDTIAGAVWSGRDLLDSDRTDGIAKLRFGRGTLDLPMHVHEHSDRLLVVMEGEGVFHLSSETLDGFEARDIRSIPVKVGDVLIFGRGLMHTFSAPFRPLVLLSYHATLINFDDPRQYTVPAVRWTPRMTRGPAKSGTRSR